MCAYSVPIWVFGAVSLQWFSVTFSLLILFRKHWRSQHPWMGVHTELAVLPSLRRHVPCKMCWVPVTSVTSEAADDILPLWWELTSNVPCCRSEMIFRNLQPFNSVQETLMILVSLIVSAHALNSLFQCTLLSFQKIYLQPVNSIQKTLRILVSRNVSAHVLTSMFQCSVL